MFLTQRDRRFLKLCFEQHFLTRPQTITWLENFEGVSGYNSLKSASLRLTDFLVRTKFLEKCVFPFNGFSSVYNVTQYGVEALRSFGDVSYAASYILPDQNNLTHDSMVAQMRFVWEKHTGIKEWVSDRILRAEKGLNVPDAEFKCFSRKIDRDLNIALEVELVQKSLDRYLKKFKEYHASHYDFIIYVSLTKSLGDKIIELAKGITPKILVCTADELLSKKGDAELANYQSKIVINRRFYVSNA